MDGATSPKPVTGKRVVLVVPSHNKAVCIIECILDGDAPTTVDTAPGATEACKILASTYANDPVFILTLAPCAHTQFVTDMGPLASPDWVFVVADNKKCWNRDRTACVAYSVTADFVHTRVCLDNSWSAFCFKCLPECHTVPISERD